MSVIYHAHMLCNMHGCKNDLHVMEAEALSKKADSISYN